MSEAGPEERLRKRRDDVVRRLAHVSSEIDGLRTDRGAESADDEHDPEEVENIQVEDDGRAIVLALTRIDDFNDHFDVSLSDEEYETVGGLIMHELGRVPRRGESIDLVGFRFRVLRADRRGIHAVEAAVLDTAS